MARRDRERDPQPMNDLMRTLVAGRGWGERFALGRLRDAWPDVVGETVASRSEPARLQRGVLTIHTEGGAWAAELTLLSRSLTTKVEAFLGPGSVREVKVSVRP